MTIPSYPYARFFTDPSYPTLGFRLSNTYILDLAITIKSL
jgi:hypothetical protein